MNFIKRLGNVGDLIRKQGLKNLTRSIIGIKQKENLDEELEKKLGEVTNTGNSTYNGTGPGLYIHQGPIMKSAKDLLQEMVDTPPIKIPFWLIQNKEDLERVGIEIKEEY